MSVENPVLPPLDSLRQSPYKGVKNSHTLSPCQSCRTLVKSFLKAVEETSRGNFEGGDALWEKNKLGNYADSELRFIEIEEKLCSDVTKGKDQCHNLAEEYESSLEEWFYDKRKNNVDFLEFLCINHLKVCCPDNTYGPSCQPCPGGMNSPCSGHGKCKGAGTRKGSGKCKCDIGYSGELCDSCKIGFYRDTNTSDLLCKSCDIACKDHCRGPGPQACEICADGYEHSPEHGCVAKFEPENEEENDFNDLEGNETESSKESVDSKIGLESTETHDSKHVEF